MERYILSRHSRKPDKENPESQEYPGLSEPGVEQARKEKSAELKKIIDEAPARALIFIGATSELVRTHSTSRLYGEGLKELYQGDEDVIVLTKEDADRIRKGSLDKSAKSLSQGIEKLAVFVNSPKNKDKRIVVDYPLFIEQFSFLKRWNDAYYDYLEKKYGSDEAGFMKEWLFTRGDSGIEGLRGPDPDKVAEEYLFGLERIKNFVGKYLEGRPFVATAVAHGYDLEAAIIKLIKGEVTPESFEEIIGKDFLKTTEGADITVGKNKMKIHFRGKEYDVKISEKNA